MIDILISVILPVYNGERYLKRAIESVVAQTYKNWELIIVNDGSMDQSLNICNSYKKNDTRIIVINKQNTGVSDTRNIGIKKAQGKYILFLDADDFFEQNCLEEVVKMTRSYSLDLIIFNYFEVTSSKRVQAREITLEYNENILPKTVIETSLKQSQWREEKWYGNLRSVWAKVYRRDLIVKNNTKFDSDLKIGEDMVFNIKYLSCINKIKFSNLYLYNYFINEASVMHSRKWNGSGQGQLYFRDVEAIVKNNVSEGVKADLWLEIAEADWNTIHALNTSIVSKYRIFEKLTHDDLYIRFSTEKYKYSSYKQKMYIFAIRHNLVWLLMCLSYYRMKKHMQV